MLRPERVGSPATASSVALQPGKIQKGGQAWVPVGPYYRIPDTHTVWVDPVLDGVVLIDWEEGGILLRNRTNGAIVYEKGDVMANLWVAPGWRTTRELAVRSRRHYHRSTLGRS